MGCAGNAWLFILVPMMKFSLVCMLPTLHFLLVLVFTKVGRGAHVTNFLDFQFLALANSTEEDRTGVASLHQFWQTERKGLSNYLLSKYKHLFDQDQSHMKEDLDRPCTLCILFNSIRCSL